VCCRIICMAGAKSESLVTLLHATFGRPDVQKPPGGGFYAQPLTRSCRVGRAGRLKPFEHELTEGSIGSALPNNDLAVLAIVKLKAIRLRVPGTPGCCTLLPLPQSFKPGILCSAQFPIECRILRKVRPSGYPEVTTTHSELFADVAASMAVCRASSGNVCVRIERMSSKPALINENNFK
jgi:hypothetical protein